MPASKGKIAFSFGAVDITADSVNVRQLVLDEIIMHLIGEHKSQITCMLNRACELAKQRDELVDSKEVIDRGQASINLSVHTSELTITVRLSSSVELSALLVAQAIWQLTLTCVFTRLIEDPTVLAKLGTNQHVMGTLAPSSCAP